MYPVYDCPQGSIEVHADGPIPATVACSKEEALEILKRHFAGSDLDPISVEWNVGPREGDPDSFYLKKWVVHK